MTHLDTAQPLEQHLADHGVDQPGRAEHLAEHHLGDEPVVTGDGREATVHVGRLSTLGDFESRGEFDLPPAVPVVLVGEVPWELREA